MRHLVEFDIEEVKDMIKDRVLKTLEDNTHTNPTKEQLTVHVSGSIPGPGIKFVVEIHESLLRFNQGPYR